MSAMHDWWATLTTEEQDDLNRIARESILELDHYPMIFEAAAELAAWQSLAIDVMNAHIEWMEAAHAKFDRRGIAWTVENVVRYCWWLDA